MENHKEPTCMVAQTATTSGTQLEKEKNHLSKAQASSIRGINNGRRGFSSLRLFRNSLASSKLKPLLFLPPIWANTKFNKVSNFNFPSGTQNFILWNKCIPHKYDISCKGPRYHSPGKLLLRENGTSDYVSSRSPSGERS